jgi:hypothetical protein
MSLQLIKESMIVSLTFYSTGEKNIAPLNYSLAKKSSITELSLILISPFIFWTAITPPFFSAMDRLMMEFLS